MAWTRGNIRHLKVGTAHAIVELDTSTGAIEPFVLWRAGTVPPAFDTVVLSMQVALLKDAMVNDLEVVISHSDTSSTVNMVRVDARPTP